MEGANVAARHREWSNSINAVELAIEKLFGGRIVENLSRQTIDAVGKEADFISGEVGNTLSLRDESSQHTVMTLVSAFLAGRIGMSKVHP